MTRHGQHGTPWPDAVKLAAAAARPLPAVELPLFNAVGHTCAADVRGLIPVPHYDSSAMDGWAVTGPEPWRLLPAAARLEPGQAVGIVTGGLLPAGADAVLRSEYGAVDEYAAGNEVVAGRGDPAGHGAGAASASGLSLLRTNGRGPADEPAPGHHIRRAGQELAAGEVAICAGTVVNPAHAAIAAVCGHDVLSVYPHPAVRLVFTGDEVDAAGIPAPGRVRDTFGPQLAHVVTALGGDVAGELRLPDQLAPLTEAITDPRYDVVITTGGTGTSDADHLRSALAEAGAELLVSSVSMRPGHPALLARLPGGRWLVGLPGNPLAAMMAVLTLVEPLLAGFNGRGESRAAAQAHPRVLSGTELPPLPGRHRLVPCTFTPGGRAVPVEWVGPSMMRGLAAAHAVMVVPPPGLRAGEPVELLELPWFAAGGTARGSGRAASPNRP